MRVAYVAATRARDLLVVPAIGDAPYEPGWVSPLNAALYPPLDARRETIPAPWTSHFGPDSVLDREASIPYSNVKPGVHVIERAEGQEGNRAEAQERRSAEAQESGRAEARESGRADERAVGQPGEKDAAISRVAATGHSSLVTARVTWWDPGALDLGRQPAYGLRREELIAKDAPAGVVEASLQRFRSWKVGHAQTIEAGSRPGVRVLTVRASAAQPPEEGDALPPVRVEVLKRSGARPAGPRFGALVHAVLALAPLDADATVVSDLARQQARLLDATDAEVAAACDLVRAVLGHPLLTRAHDAARLGRLRREAPVALLRPSGILVEGVVDLAFEDDDGWTVVDFKTDADVADQLETYLRQVQLYAAAIARATGRPAEGVLLRI